MLSRSRRRLGLVTLWLESLTGLPWDVRFGRTLKAGTRIPLATDAFINILIADWVSLYM